MRDDDDDEGGGTVVAVAPTGLISCCCCCWKCFFDGGGAAENIVVDDDGDGAVDCGICLPGVFNISIRLLSIRCSLKASVLLFPLFVRSFEGVLEVFVYVCCCDVVDKCTLAGIRLYFDKDNGTSGLGDGFVCCWSLFNGLWRW